MSSRGSGHGPDYQERPSKRRPTQQYHEDTYQRSSSYEETDDDASRIRNSRPARLPGMTPHYDPYRHMPSIASQYQRSFTTHAEAASDVAVNPSSGTPTHRRNSQTTSNVDRGHWKYAQQQDPSWSYRESAEPKMFTGAGTNGYLYPQTIDILSEQPAPTRQRCSDDCRPIANDPDAVAYYNARVSRPQYPQAPLERSHTQRNDFRADPQGQWHTQRTSTHDGSYSSTDDRDRRPRYGRPPPQAHRYDHKKEEQP